MKQYFAYSFPIASYGKGKHSKRNLTMAFRKDLSESMSRDIQIKPVSARSPVLWENPPCEN